MAITIRLATLADAERILEIYNPFIETSCVTFEYNKLTLDEFKERMLSIQNKFPWIVYELDGTIIGYAYTSSSHSRAAYSWNCDASIYIDQAYQGKGIGSTLYNALFHLMREMGYYNVYAIVTSQNPVSLGFHNRFGFEVEGHHDNTGYKFGKWLGVTRLVKRIGDFSKSPDSVKTIQQIDFKTILDTYK